MFAYIAYGMSHLRGRGTSRESRRLRGALVGLGLSLIPFIVVLQMSGGMIEGITARYMEVGSFHIQIRNFGDPSAEEVSETVERITRIPGVRLAVPGWTGTALASVEGRRTGLAVRAFPPDIYDSDSGLRKYLRITAGSFDLETDKGLLLSRDAARLLGTDIGDEVKLLTSRSVRGGDFILRQSTFTVTGLYSSGYADLDAATALISLSEGEKLFTDPGSAFVGVKVEDPFEGLERIHREADRAVSGDWYAYTWYDLDRSLYKSFQTTRSLLLFIMALIVVTASANISSAMHMLVMEKREDIAILKSSGASPSGIAFSFLCTGFVLGLSAAAVGCAAGILAAVRINELIALLERAITFVLSAFGSNGSFTLLSPEYYLESIPVAIGFPETASAAALAVVLSTFAAYLPARRAGRLDPVEILSRH